MLLVMNIMYGDGQRRDARATWHLLSRQTLLLVPLMGVQLLDPNYCILARESVQVGAESATDTSTARTETVSPILRRHHHPLPCAVAPESTGTTKRSRRWDRHRAACRVLMIVRIKTCGAVLAPTKSCGSQRSLRQTRGLLWRRPTRTIYMPQARFAAREFFLPFPPTSGQRTRLPQQPACLPYCSLRAAGL